MYGDESEGRRAKVADPENDGAPVGVSFVRPLAQVVVTSPFGERSGEPHDGVDLKASTGTPVYAAHSGLVLYADGRIRGYGKMIVIKHASGVSTIYAHNSKLLVKRGFRVIQGQRIALSGETGNAKGPHLHFEVRRGMSPVDPEPILARAGEPQPAKVSARTGGRRSRRPATVAPQATR